jgi:hypothetical protein
MLKGFITRLVPQKDTALFISEGIKKAVADILWF